jgi:hypothetical protein
MLSGKQELAMSDLLIQMTDSFRYHRDDLKRRLDMLESGEFGVGNQLPNVAAIEDTKRRLKNIIEELERLIVDYDPRLS